MVDGKIGNILERAQADVNRDAAASIVFQPQPTPTHNRSTLRAKVDFQRRVGFSGPRIGAGNSFHPDALIFEIISPKCTIATA